jgi:hypothetical protein
LQHVDRRFFAWQRADEAGDASLEVGVVGVFVGGLDLFVDRPVRVDERDDLGEVVVVAVEDEDSVLGDLAADADYFGVGDAPGVEVSGVFLLVVGCVVVAPAGS